MKNKEFWKGAVAGALVVTCIGTGAFAGTGLAAKGTALGDRKFLYNKKAFKSIIKSR